MRHFTRLAFILGLVLALAPTVTAAETPVESNVDSRLTLAFQAREAELQTWLPAPWQVSAAPAGPSKGANLFVVFGHRLLSLVPDGKPSAFGGTDRFAVLIISAKHAQSGEAALFVMRIYATDHAGLPGPYKNSVKASVRREVMLKGENLEAGTAGDNWEVKDASGASMVVRFSHQRSLPVRSKTELRVRSTVEPSFYRIYRVDQGTEILKSVPLGVDRLQSYEFRSTIAELAKLLDSSAQLVSIMAHPWYVREVSLP